MFRKQGIDVLFDHPSQECYLKKDGKVVGKAILQNNLWVLQTNPTTLLPTPTPTPTAATAIHAISATTCPPERKNADKDEEPSTYLAFSSPSMATVPVSKLNRPLSRRAMIGPARTVQPGLPHGDWTKVSNRKEYYRRKELSNQNSGKFDGSFDTCHFLVEQRQDSFFDQ